MVRTMKYSVVPILGLTLIGLAVLYRVSRGAEESAARSTSPSASTPSDTSSTSPREQPKPLPARPMASSTRTESGQQISDRDQYNIAKHRSSAFESFDPEDAEYRLAQKHRELKIIRYQERTMAAERLKKSGASCPFGKGV